MLVASAPRSSAGTAGRSTLGALAAQFLLDFGASAGRAWLIDGTPSRALLPMVAPVYTLDAALAPIGAIAAGAAVAVGPGLVLLVVPLATVLSVLSGERRARIDQALELSEAYQGTALLLGDVVEADDDYTGIHSRDVVDLSLRSPTALASGPRNAATSSSPPCSTTSARSRCRRRSSTSPARSTTPSGRSSAGTRSRASGC